MRKRHVLRAAGTTSVDPRLTREEVSASVREAFLARNGHLMALGVESGDRLFVPDVGLLRQKHPLYPHYTGLVVSQTPLEYAIALLETGGDAKRANLIIRRTADFQDRDAQSPTYGNFFWMTHWKAVHDRNAVSFMIPNYAYLWRHHRAKLDARTRKSLEGLFPLALRGLLAHRVPVAYTNIFLLNILSKLELSALLTDEAVRREALADWAAWVTEVSAHAIGEFNSPCYTAVDLYALEGILDAAPTDELRRQAGKMLEYVWTEFAANYHAGIRCLTGPMSRAYPADYLYGNGLGAVIAYQQFGSEVAEFDSNGGLTPFVVNFAMRRYVVPAYIRAVALEKKWPVTIRGWVPGRHISWTNYLDRDFALGSQTGYYGVQEMPLFLAFRSRRKRRSLFFKSDPPISVLASAQEANVVLGGFHYPKAMSGSHDGKQTNASAVIRLFLGPSTSLRQCVMCRGTRVRPGALLDASRPIALALGSVRVGIKAFLVDPSGNAGPASLERHGAETAILWRTGAGPDAPMSTAGFLIVVSRRSDDANLRAFARRMERYRIRVKARRDGIVIEAEGEGSRLLVTLPPPKRAAALFLHVSPYLRLRPGDLWQQVKPLAE